MEKVKNKDFIELDFVARIKGSNQIFDLTDTNLAKKEGIYQEDKEYKPLTLCLGAGHILKGLNNELEGKEVGKEYNFELLPENAFGRRNPKLIKLTTLKQFKDKGVTPIPGLQLAIDGAIATIRSVSGGRVIIDFNHPLAGKTLLYKVKINKKVTDTKEKISGIISVLTGIKQNEYSVNIAEKNIKIEIKGDVPEQVIAAIKKQITELVPEIQKKKVEINTKK